MLFSASPQPGQKSSFVLNSFGRLARSFFFVPVSALRADDLVLFVDRTLLDDHVDEQFLELAGEPLSFLRRTAPGDHRLPRLEVRVEGRRFVEKREPTVEELVVELLGIDDPRLVGFRLAHHAPGCLHVLRRLKDERLGQLLRLLREDIAKELLLLLDPLLGCLVFLDDGLRGPGVLVVLRVEEHAGERVVVLGRDRVVLVVVAARAPDGQAEQAAADHVHAVVSLVGVRDLDSAVVVVPRTETQKPERREMPHLRARIAHQVGGELRRDELGRTACRR